jgi:hypothetical protein
MVDGAETDAGTDGAAGGALAQERGVTGGLRAAAWRVRLELLVLVPKVVGPHPGTDGCSHVVPVRVTQETDASSIEIVLPDGARVRVREGTPAEWVRSTVAALRSAC